MLILMTGAGLVAVTGLAGVLVARRKARKRGRPASAEPATHPHYCPECDREWPHAGQTCLRSWALFCLTCSAVSTGTDVATAGSRA